VFIQQLSWNLQCDTSVLSKKHLIITMRELMRLHTIQIELNYYSNDQKGATKEPRYITIHNSILGNTFSHNLP
jgi:hypothetical protein